MSTAVACTYADPFLTTTIDLSCQCHPGRAGAWNSYLLFLSESQRTLRVYLWDSIQSDSQVRADSKMYLDNCCDLIYEEGFCLFATWRGRQRRNRVFASCERRRYLTQPVLLRQPTEFSLCELDPSRAFASFVSPSTLFSSKAMFPKICWPTVSQFCSVTVLCFGWCNSNIWPDSQKWISPTDR